MDSSTTTSTYTSISNRFTFNNKRLHDNQQIPAQQQIHSQQQQQQQLPSTRFAFNQLRPSISPIRKKSPLEQQQSNITRNDIKNSFHFTKPLAIKNLRVTQKQMKSITKKYKIERWPYRKINAIETIHSFLLKEKEKYVNSSDKEYIDKVDKNIEKVKKMKNEIYNNPNEKYPLLKNKYHLLL